MERDSFTKIEGGGTHGSPTYTGMITQLRDNQVFVFGSNLIGFHGAGSAGFASFGVTGYNHWRQVGYGSFPKGWQGKWNVKGVGEGFQVGTEGKSYALPTVSLPGKRRSLSKGQIGESIQKLYAFAREHQDLEFLVAYCDDGKQTLNGYTKAEMALMFSCEKIPENVIFEKIFSQLIPMRGIASLDKFYPDFSKKLS